MKKKRLTPIARKLRKHSTNTELRLWRYLRDRQIEGLKFRRQQQVGVYIADFVNFEKKVIIEVDGGQHALNSNDRIRDEWFRSEGYNVLRFWDNQVFSNLEGVLETIRRALITPHPDPLPQGARENMDSTLKQGAKESMNNKLRQEEREGIDNTLKERDRNDSLDNISYLTGRMHGHLE